MSKPSGSLRSAMPGTADFIDAARAVFGEADVNEAIKAGMHGAGTFFAQEAGREVGSLPRSPAFSVSGDALFASVPVKRATTTRG